jgi:hypothetical protein
MKVKAKLIPNEAQDGSILDVRRVVQAYNCFYQTFMLSMLPQMWVLLTRVPPNR